MHINRRHPAAHAVLLANDDNHHNNPMIMAYNKMLKKTLQNTLERVQKYAKAIKVLAGAEVAIVVLFQIMPHNTNVTREGVRDRGGAAEMEVLR